MIPTNFVIAQLVPELHPTMTIGLGGVLAIAAIAALTLGLIASTIRDLRAERQQDDRGGQPARSERPRQAA